jgi:RNA polymerase sigma-70 factor (ECF subfamily)
MSPAAPSRHTGMNTKADFTALVEPHRRELQVHCYRMTGSLEDSEDLVQETLLRAWRGRDTYAGRASVRAWLYRIATNACLDAIAKRPRAGDEVLWLEPYPDELLEGLTADDAGPDAAVVAKETIELAFMTAIQHLPPRQRAVLILRGVLGWSAKDTADLLDSSIPSVNSALQRARRALKQRLPERRLEWAPDTDATDEERALLDRYVEATERADAYAVKEMLSEDARFSMPPEPGLWEGPDAIVDAWIEGGFGTAEFGDLRCVLTRANLQPVVACYHRRPGKPEYEPLAMDVLRIADGRITEIVTFPPKFFPALGLPPTP